MAVTICLLLTTVLTATVIDAAFPNWGGMNGFGFNNGMNYEYIRPLSLPSFSNFPLPQPPPLLWPSNVPKPNIPQLNFPQPNFPQLNFPQLNFPPMTMPDIASQPAVPGSNFNGMSIASQATVSRGPDGKVQQTGGTTMVTNKNGEVTVEKFGNAPPDVKRTVYTNVPFGDFVEDPELMQFKHSFDIPTFTMPPMPPMPPTRDMDYVPGPNEKFQAKSYRSSYRSEDINGVKTSSGEYEFVSNDNGKVKRKKDKFHKGPE